MLTLSEVTNIVIERRKKIVPPRAKKRRSIIDLHTLEKYKQNYSLHFIIRTNIYGKVISIKM